MTCLLKLKEAAAYLNLHPVTVRRLCRNGHLPFLLVNGQYRFEQTALRYDLAANAAALEQNPEETTNVE